MLDLTLSFGSAALAGTSNPVYDADADALFARMTVAPNDTRKGLINTLISSLKVAGLWAKLDLLYVMAAHDAQAARLNWLSTSFNLTAVAAPTFTTDRGYQGDGSTSYLNTSFVPSTAGGKVTLNSAHIGGWSLTDSLDNTEFGHTGSAPNGQLYLACRALNGTCGARLNDNSGEGSSIGQSAIPSGIGHSVGTRTGPNARELLKNGASLKTDAISSGLLTSSALRVCAAGGGYSAKQMAICHLGSGISASETLAFYNAFNTYLSAVGAA